MASSGGTFADIALRVGAGKDTGSGPNLNSSNRRIASTFAQVAMDVGQGSSKGQLGSVVNIVEFCEAPWGLNMHLMPVQRVILKAHYGIPLDDTTVFQLRDWRGQRMRDYTEKSYLKHLFDEKRCNISEVIPGDERREMVLSVGRRSGKTFLAAAITAYETYKLLMKECPQEYYGLLPTNTIQIVSVATDRDQAGLLYREANGHFRSCGFFLPYAANSTQTYARFQTPRDIDKFGRYSDDPTAKATLNVTFKSCIAKSLRGAGNLVVILDEMAHFTDNGQSSAEEVYKAITPSKSTFARKDPITKMPVPGPDGMDGIVESRIIAISSPLGRQGQFYKLFQQAMKGGRPARGMLAIEAPTWEVNPTIPVSELETEYFKDPVSFFVEYGGEFSDRTRGWIEREVDLLACIHPSHRPITQAPARRPHFVGIDFGFVNDYTAIAIGHQDVLDGERVIVLDYIDRIRAGEGKFAGKERLDFDDAIDWVFDLSKRFYFSEGIFDQFYGKAIEDAVAKKGLRQLKCHKFTQPEHSEIYQNFKGMMWDQRLVLFDWPIPDDPGKPHCTYIAELLELQAEEHSKYVTLVHKPKVEGKSDDMSDALVRMVWLASQDLGTSKRITGSYGASSIGATQAHQMGVMQRKAQLKARRAGSDPARQPARFHKGGRFTAGRF